MKSPLLDSALVAILLVGGVGGCTALSSEDPNGPDGSTASGGGTSSGGTTVTGGTTHTGGTNPTGGVSPTGGTTVKGGAGGTGGTGRAGNPGSGGSKGGATGTGGQPGTGGGAVGGGTGAMVDCNAVMPTGGQQHSGNMQGGTSNLAWQIWSNQNTGTLTTFSGMPAFSAAWNNSGDYLGRLGFEWGNSAKAYDSYGTITAQYAYKKTGSGGGYSYIGIYGWSTNPCIEWYIVDDSFGTMPVNPGSTTNKGTVDLDDGTYILYTRPTTGTGGSRCGNATSWTQYYSVRKKARQCGQISITKHFDAWKAKDMPLGNLLEAKILVEAGGGSGSVDFPIANVTLTP